MLDNELGRRIRRRYIIIPAIVLLSLVCGGAAYFYGIIRGGEHDAAAIAVADSISRADSIAMARQLRRMQQIAEDSTMYESERTIAPSLLDKWEPVLKKWLDFRRIELRDFRLMAGGLLDTASMFIPFDSLNLYYHEFDDAFQGIYTPQSRDYSPNCRRYINLLETTYVYQDGQDGKWYYKGSDDCQEIRLVDLDRRTDHMFLFTGTSFVDAAFWADDECFLLTKFEYNYPRPYYMVICYDIGNATTHYYRLLAEAIPEDSYLEYDMLSRGIILE